MKIIKRKAHKNAQFYAVCCFFKKIIAKWCGNWRNEDWKNEKPKRTELSIAREWQGIAIAERLKVRVVHPLIVLFLGKCDALTTRKLGNGINQYLSFGDRRHLFILLMPNIPTVAKMSTTTRLPECATIVRNVSQEKNLIWWVLRILAILS